MEGLSEASRITRVVLYGRFIRNETSIVPDKQLLQRCLKTTGAYNKQLSRVRRLKYLVVNVFVAFHVVTIAFWCVPVNSPLIPLFRNLVRPYFIWSGLFQSWDMFAPIPKAANTYVEALVVYKDGSRKTWTFPRMEKLGITEKFFKERYRRLAENLLRDDTDALLPDAARYIARTNSNPDNHVRLVILIHKWSLIAPRPDGSYVPEPWQQNVLLGYGVQPEDLQ